MRPQQPFAYDLVTDPDIFIYRGARAAGMACWVEKVGRSITNSDTPQLAVSSTRDHNGTHRVGEDATAYAGDLYLLDLIGKRWHRLTKTNGIDEDYPTFSPDETRIAYVRVDSIQTPQVTDNYHHTIYEINSDGSCPTRLRDDLTDTFEYYAPNVATRPQRPRQRPRTC